MNVQLDDYLQRQLKTALAAALADTPVVCILGPRQCGKSTLAKRYDPKRHYLTLDDQNYLNLAMEDPQGFVSFCGLKCTTILHFKVHHPEVVFFLV